MIKNLFIFSILMLAALCNLTATAAQQQQRRDSLTEAEIELVRDAQLIDARTELFTKAIDRRLVVLNIRGGAVDDKKLKKDAEKWGEPPAGTRLQLLTDIKKILAEAIDNIDDVAAHDKRLDEKLFRKAVRTLAAASNRYLPELRAALDQTTDEREKGAILSALESCKEIIEAAAKVPKEEPAEKKKKGGGK